MNEENTNSAAGEVKTPANFIHQIIDEDIRNNKNNGRVHTRFTGTQRISPYRSR